MTEGPAERPESAGLPEHEQQAWDAIVADLSGQIDLGPQFRPDPVAPEPVAHAAAPGVDADDGADDDDDDEGYTPPHPPPMPRPADTIGRFAWSAVIGGPVLVVAVNLLGWESWIAGLGVLATIGGFAALIARMSDERDDDGSNGAVV